MLIPIFLFGQESGKIAGTVQDAQTGEPLSGANVLVEGTSFGAATDSEGAFRVMGVPAGVYTVRAEFIGYQPMRMANVRVSYRLTTEVDLALTPEALEGGVVNVTAEKPLVNTNATNAVRSFDSDQIANLATRDVTDFFAAQAGVVLQNNQIHVRGSRPDEVGYELEGASTNSMFIGGLTQMGGVGNAVGGGGETAFNLGSAIPDALEEVSLQLGGYTADMGGANAGIIQQKLKTGGTSLSGALRYETEAPAIGDIFGNGTTHNYGGTELTASLGGPLTSRIRFFGAVQTLGTDDYAPMVWDGAVIAANDSTGEASWLFDRVPGGNFTTDSVQIQWDAGAVPGRRSDRTTYNGTLLFDFNPLVLRFGFSTSKSITGLNGLPIKNLFRVDRLSEQERTSLLYNIKATYFLSSNTMVFANFNSFTFSMNQYDRAFGKPDGVLDFLAWGDREAVMAIDSSWGEAFVYVNETDSTGYYERYTYDRPLNVELFQFARPGGQNTPTFAFNGPSMLRQNYIGMTGGLNSQMGNHDIKLGFEYRYYTLSRYQFLAIPQMNQAIDNDDNMTHQMFADKDPIAAREMRGGGVKNFGFDEFGDEYDKGEGGVDGAKHPKTTAIYFNDKIEMRDIVLNLGIRYDIFDLDDFTLTDPENPWFDQANFTVLEDGLEKSDVKSVLQPRLGLAFPLSDRSVFHLQYGKFAQMPDLALPYKGRAEMATNFGGQNFMRNPLGYDLGPMVTTQYEAGYSLQFVDGAALDVTAFTRNTTGQMTLQRIGIEKENEYNAAWDTNVYTNGDFTAASGIELSLTSRRIGHFQTTTNYTFTDARGTGSFPNAAVGNLNNEGTEFPTMISPLNFSQKHRGMVILDYRYGANEGGLLANAGANLMFSFNSGHPFTRADGTAGQRGPDEGGLLNEVDSRTRTPIEPIGSSTTPWNFNLDIKLEKGLTLGNVNMSAYVRIYNALNTRNVINVYNRTGNAYDDGFFTSPELSEKILAANSDTYAELYQVVNLDNRQHVIQDIGLDNFSPPRQVNAGIIVEF
jgi:hypothetical protein